MHRTLTDTRARRAAGDRGFTLIELLVVVVILGVLIAIAIPVYSNYRKGANDAAAQSDMRNAVSLLEVCNTSDGRYPSAPGPVPFGDAAASVAVEPCTGQKANTSKGTVFKYWPNAAGTCYVLVGTNAGGANKYWQYNSRLGGSIAPSTVEAYNNPPSC